MALEKDIIIDETPEIDELYEQLTPEEIEFSVKDREKQRKKHIASKKEKAKAQKSCKILEAKKNRLEREDAFPERLANIAVRVSNSKKKVARSSK